MKILLINNKKELKEKKFNNSIYKHSNIFGIFKMKYLKKQKNLYNLLLI